MSKIKRFLSLVLSFFINNLPTSLLWIVEEKAQIAMGKGFGASSTEDEASAIAYFVKKHNFQQLCVLDVGANLGNWTASIIEALPGVSVVAFEPSQKAFSHLTDRYRFTTNVHLVNKALGRVDAETSLYADESASGLGSMTRRRVQHFGIEFNYEEKIEVIQLDTWLSTEGINHKPNILKMDVKGHELDVLAGSTNSLGAIRIVQFEFGGSNIDTRTYFQDFWYFFHKLNFQIYRISPSGPKIISNYRESDETFRPTNYLAVRSQLPK